MFSLATRKETSHKLSLSIFLNFNTTVTCFNYIWSFKHPTNMFFNFLKIL
jgi:hypothetical protein